MAEIEVQRVGRRIAEIPIIGTAPHIQNKFSEKAQQMMLDAQQGRRKIKEAKDPEANFHAALHRLPDGRYGFPATGFKGAIVGGARYFQDKKLSMTLLKQALFVTGEGPDMLVPLETSEPVNFGAPVRNASGVADLRFRPRFDEWSAVLHILFIPSLMSAETVAALVDAGGFGGIGDWRPSAPKSATGVYGTFELDDSQEIRTFPVNQTRKAQRASRTTKTTRKPVRKAARRVA